MVTQGDFIRLDYFPDLTHAGITYTCKSLAKLPHQWVKPTADQLRASVGSIAVELAFRRYLNSQQIPHKTIKIQPFTAPDQHNIAIGGRRCNINISMLTKKNQIEHTLKTPTVLLDALAIVPKQNVIHESWNDDDLLIFAFLSALITTNHQSNQKAIESSQPFCLVRSLPAKWAKPNHWRSLGNIHLTNHDRRAITTKLGGQDVNRGYQTEEVIIDPGVNSYGNHDFYTLNYLQAFCLPEKKLGIHSPNLRYPYYILPQEWWNIWIYGMEITLAGFITGKEFRERAKPHPVGSMTFHGTRTEVDSMSVPISTLHSLNRLLKQAKAWQKTF
jgi:hypothetical protein